MATERAKRQPPPASASLLPTRAGRVGTVGTCDPLTSADVFIALCRLRANGIAIRPDATSSVRERTALAMYPQAAAFNHSCRANVAFRCVVRCGLTILGVAIEMTVTECLHHLECQSCCRTRSSNVPLTTTCRIDQVGQRNRKPFLSPCLHAVHAEQALSYRVRALALFHMHAAPADFQTPNASSPRVTRVSTHAGSAACSWWPAPPAPHPWPPARSCACATGRRRARRPPRCAREHCRWVRGCWWSRGSTSASGALFQHALAMSAVQQGQASLGALHFVSRNRPVCHKHTRAHLDWGPRGAHLT